MDLLQFLKIKKIDAKRRSYYLYFLLDTNYQYSKILIVLVEQTIKALLAIILKMLSNDLEVFQAVKEKFNVCFSFINYIFK